MKKLLFLLFPIAAMALTVFAATGHSPRSTCGTNSGVIGVGDAHFSVTLAVTQASWEQGLSGRPQLLPDEGMLFLFPYPAMRAFWMKDMNFPIDIVWIDSEWRIVGMEKHASPATYPSTFTSPSPVARVLEIASGMSDRIHVGDRMQFACSK